MIRKICYLGVYVCQPIKLILDKVLGEVLERGSGRHSGRGQEGLGKMVNVDISLDVNQKMKSRP